MCPLEPPPAYPTFTCIGSRRKKEGLNWVAFWFLFLSRARPLSYPLKKLVGFPLPMDSYRIPLHILHLNGRSRKALDALRCEWILRNFSKEVSFSGKSLTPENPFRDYSWVRVMNVPLIRRLLGCKIFPPPLSPFPPTFQTQHDSEPFRRRDVSLTSALCAL